MSTQRVRQRRIRCFKTAIITGTVISGLLTWWGFPREKRLPVIAQTVQITGSEKLTARDSLLGFKTQPGTFHISIQAPSLPGSLAFDATLDEQGYRTTSPGAPAHNSSRPDVAIFGCSYVWGWGVSNHETFPWLIQAARPDWRVRNLGNNAYGQVQQVVQLEDVVATGSAPRVAVFTFNEFHLARNVVTPEWRNQFGGAAIDVLRARLIDGALRLDQVPAFGPEPSSLTTAAQEEMVEVACRLFTRLADQCHASNIVTVLAVQECDSLDHPVVQHARQLGFRIVDLRMPAGLRREDYLCLPYDYHPNAAAHRYYAAALLPVLDGTLDEPSSPGHKITLLPVVGAFEPVDSGTWIAGRLAVNVAVRDKPASLDGDIAAHVCLPAHGDAHIGVMARHRGPGDSNMYLAALARNGERRELLLWKNVNGEWTSLAAETVASDSGELKLRVAGPFLQASFAGRTVGVVDASLREPGKTGVRGTKGSAVRLAGDIVPANQGVAVPTAN